MARKTRKVKLDVGKAISEVLKEYGEEVSKVVAEQVPKAANIARDAVEEKAPKRTGEYAKSWDIKYQYGLNRLDRKAIVYSKDHYRLTHLLENGHATRNGGRTKKIEHIKPAADETAEKFEALVKEAIKNAS